MEPIESRPSARLLRSLYEALQEGSGDATIELRLARMIQSVSARRHPAGVEEVVTAEWGDLTFRVDAGDRLGAEFFHGLYRELPEALALLYSLPPGGRLLDVGANFGFFTILGAKLLGPGGAVFAIEPHPRARALLQENLERNGLAAAATVSGDAIGATDGEAPFHFAAESAFSGLGDTGRARIERVQPVRVRSLDSLAREHRWPAVHGVKVDVEGFEYAVLEGGRALLKASAETVVLLEFNSKNLTPDRRQRLADALAAGRRDGLEVSWIDWVAGQAKPLVSLTGAGADSLFLARPDGAGAARLAQAIRKVAALRVAATRADRDGWADRMRLALAMQAAGELSRQRGADDSAGMGEDRHDRAAVEIATLNRALAEARGAVAQLEARVRDAETAREAEIGRSTAMVRKTNAELAVERGRAEAAAATLRAEYQKLQAMSERQAADLKAARAEYAKLQAMTERQAADLKAARAEYAKLQAMTERQAADLKAARAEYAKLQAMTERQAAELKEARHERERALRAARAEYDKLEQMVQRVDAELKEARRSHQALVAALEAELAQARAAAKSGP